MNLARPQYPLSARSRRQDELLRFLLDLALDATRAHAASLQLADGESLRVTLSAGQGAPAAGTVTPMTGSVAGDCVRRGRVVLGMGGSLMAAPVQRLSQTVGAIVLQHRDPGRFHRTQAAFVARLAELAGGIWMAMPGAESERRASLEVQAATKLAVVASSQLEDAAVWQEIADGAATLLDAASVRVAEVADGELICRAAAGRFAGEVGRDLPRTGLEGLVVERIDGLLVADWQHSADAMPADAWIGSILAAPIRRVEAVLGTITVADQVPARFSEHDRAALLRYGLHAAAALTGTRLRREEVRRSEEDRQAAVAAEALRRSEERHRSLIANAVEAIFTLDRRGVITSANEATVRLWQWGPGRGVGEHWRTIPLFQQLDEAERQIQLSFAGESRSFETEVLQRDGQRRLLALSFSPILEDGRPTAVLGMARDITDWRRVQGQLLQVEKMAAIGQLVGGMAHEINNPLASISVNLDLLIDEVRIPDQLEALRAIKSEAQRATALVRSLLTYLRGQGSERAVVDLREIVRGVTALRRYQLLNQQVELISDAGLAAVPVRGNTVNLQQVLMNLIANAEHAIRHGPGHGHIWIRVQPLEDRVRLTVEDDGPGVPPELLTRVFDPFFTTKPEGEGTGLGLSVSAGIVADHLGRLSAEPRPGGGACFIMELPLSASPALPVPPRVTPTGGTEAHGVGRKRILVVDDEPSIRRSVAKFLSREGWEVQLAESGDEGLRLAAAVEFDAVLCDLRMPGMSGHEFFRQLQVLRSPLEHRLVFMTGDVISAEAQGFLSGTGRPVLSKPFDIADLLDALNRVVLV